MSRAFSPPARLVRRASLVGSSLALLLAASVGAPVAAQTTAPAGDLPACADAALPRDGVLSTWPQDAIEGTPSLFGTILSGEGTWVTDAVGDAPSDGLDILAVGVTAVDIEDAKAIRKDAGLLTRGKRKQAVKGGEAVLIRTIVDRPVEQIDADHAGIFVGTDVDGSRSNNAPAAARNADSPFTGLQDVYSLAYASSTGKTKLLYSDLAKGWYKGKESFAASQPAPGVLDILIRPEAIGEGLKVVTFVSGPDGGYDSVSIGPSAIPVDGRVGLAPVCIEGTIEAEPFTVPRLIENGQTLRDIEVPASWQGGAAFDMTADERAAMERLIAARDEDGDGRIGLPSTIGLFEDGLITRQRPEVELAIDGDRLNVAIRLGLTRRGFDILRDVVLSGTDDATADAYLERVARALTATMPPFRSARKSGPVAGAGQGSCTPALTAPAPAEPEDTAEPENAAEPAAADA